MVTDRPLLVLATLVALAVLSPLLLVALQAQHAGWHELTTVLWRARSAMLLKNTVVLAAIVAVLAAALGTGAAWLTERAALPGRRLWAVLLVLPVAIPDFVVGYAWHSIAPNLAPLLGATLVMTLGTYPLVYLPVAAALRRLDPALEETARTLGTSRVAHVHPGRAADAAGPDPRRRDARRADRDLGVRRVRDPRLPDVHHRGVHRVQVRSRRRRGARGPAGRARPARRARRGGAPAYRSRLGAPATPPTPAARTAAVGRRGARAAGPDRLGVGVPVGTIVYWMLQRDHATLPAAASVAGAAWSTLQYSALGAGAAALLALPVAFVGFRRRTVTRDAIERSTYLTRAVPGVTIALSLVFFATRYAIGLYETSTLLVAAYALLGFPLALVCVKASVAQLPPGLLDVGRSLGRRPIDRVLADRRSRSSHPG